MPGSGNIPYSIMWQAMNPLFLGHFWYGVYVLIVDALATIFWATRTRVPKLYLLALQFFSIPYYMGLGAEYQNVTIIMFFPLMWYARKPIQRLHITFSYKTGQSTRQWITQYDFYLWKLVLLAAIPILLKLPVGWSYPWDLANPHVVCMTVCSGWDASHSLFAYIGKFFNNYAILVIGWLWTVRKVRAAK